MNTLRLFVDPEARPSTPGSEELARDPAIVQAAGILRDGGTVAFATETVYGLGANALDAHAVERIFIAKQRPAWDPLIVHIADESVLAKVAASVPTAARVLMDNFWPGPLTLLVPRHDGVPDAVTAGRAKVAVRMPAHRVARALIRVAGVPIAAPSANLFGHVSPTTAAHVLADLDGRIDAILDAGESTLGLESTVVDASVDPCLVYRPGAVTLEQLRAVWPAVEAFRALNRPASDGERGAGLASPGLELRHYAPRARLVLVEGEELVAGIAQALEAARGRGEKTGLMLPTGLAASASVQSSAVFSWGRWSEPAELAHRLFAGLRGLDDEGVQVIVCPLPKAEGLGVAIIDRLRKAARSV